MVNRKLRCSAVAASVAAALLGFSSVASADPLTFMPANTDFRIKFVNYENLVTEEGQELFGLINVTTIGNAAGTQTFWNGNGSTDGTSLVGYFQGLIAEADQTGGDGLSFTGGSGVLYVVPSGDFSPSTNPNTLDIVNQLCGGAACPDPWLTFDFVPGINDAINGDASLQGAFAATNVQAGFGFLSVTGGTAGDFLNTDGYTFVNFPAADMSFRSNFALQGNNCSSEASQGWAVCSDDPLDARSAAVPEPGTLALAGLAALIAGSVSRRKRLHK